MADYTRIPDIESMTSEDVARFGESPSIDTVVANGSRPLGFKGGLVLLLGAAAMTYAGVQMGFGVNVLDMPEKPYTVVAFPQKQTRPMPRLRNWLRYGVTVPANVNGQPSCLVVDDRRVIEDSDGMSEYGTTFVERAADRLNAASKSGQGIAVETQGERTAGCTVVTGIPGIGKYF